MLCFQTSHINSINACLKKKGKHSEQACYFGTDFGESKEAVNEKQVCRNVRVRLCQIQAGDLNEDKTKYQIN